MKRTVQDMKVEIETRNKIPTQKKTKKNIKNTSKRSLRDKSYYQIASKNKQNLRY